MRKKYVLMAAALLASSAAMTAAPAAAAPTIVNPGFESNGDTQTPTGWRESGGRNASFTEAGGRSGSGHRLTHSSAGRFHVETYQTLTGLARGEYTVKVWVRSSGGEATVTLRQCGGPAASTTVPVTSGQAWFQISVTASVRGGRCTIGLESRAKAGAWTSFDDLEFGAGLGSAVRIRGGDVSSLRKNTDHGAVYYTARGRIADPLWILKSAGMNLARLKVWVDPADGYNSKDKVLGQARRIKARGLDLLIDFHYSDRWADPGHQQKPAAWADFTVPQLEQAVYDHTYDVLSALKAQGTPADIVQIGNEPNGGMLWPDGNWEHWDNLAAFLTAGSNAAKAVTPSTKVMLHLGNGGDNGLYRWWFDNATSRNVPFDIIGASYYCYWHGTLAALSANLNDISARYGKPVLLAETAYGFTVEQDDPLANIFTATEQSTCGYPATPQGQAEALRAVFEVVKAVPQGRGLGVVYWEPAWTAVTGSGWDPEDPSSGNAWENQALFGYDWRALPSMAVLGQA